MWHPGLANGGSAITDRRLTRMSYVTHYRPINVNTYFYYKFVPADAKTKKIENEFYISSCFYDLDTAPLTLVSKVQLPIFYPDSIQNI